MDRPVGHYFSSEEYKQDQGITLEVLMERGHQDYKYGPRKPRIMSPAQWLSILAEEFGEAAHELTDSEFERIPEVFKDYLADARDELIQVAASAIAIIGAIDDGTITQPFAFANVRGVAGQEAMREEVGSDVGDS